MVKGKTIEQLGDWNQPLDKTHEVGLGHDICIGFSVVNRMQITNNRCSNPPCKTLGVGPMARVDMVDW